MKYLLVLVTLAFVFFILYNIGLGVPCPIKLATGFNCPSCGISRMFISILKGNIKLAFYYNQILPVILPLIAIILLRLGYRYIKYNNTELNKIENTILILCIILLLLYGILRNFYFYPYRI